MRQPVRHPTHEPFQERFRALPYPAVTSLFIANRRLPMIHPLLNLSSHSTFGGRWASASHSMAAHACDVARPCLEHEVQGVSLSMSAMIGLRLIQRKWDRHTIFLWEKKECRYSTGSISSLNLTYHTIVAMVSSSLPASWEFDFHSFNGATLYSLSSLQCTWGLLPSRTTITQEENWSGALFFVFSPRRTSTVLRNGRSTITRWAQTPGQHRQRTKDSQPTHPMLRWDW